VVDVTLRDGIEMKFPGSNLAFIDREILEGKQVDLIFH